MTKDSAENATSNVAFDPTARPAHIKADSISLPIDATGSFPYLKLLQALSPECDRGNAEAYMKDARAGDFLHVTPSGKVPRDGEAGVNVVIIDIRKRYVEYVPRDAGGGFVAIYDTKEAMEANSTEGNEIRTNYDFLCVEHGAPEPMPFIITLGTPTQLPVARKWAAMMGEYKTVSGIIYNVSAKSEQNRKKQSYFNFSIKPAGWAPVETTKMIDDSRPAVTKLFLPAPEKSVETEETSEI